MSLNIIPNNNLNSISNLQAARLRSGYQSLTTKNTTQTESSGLKVNFSANHNSNVTTYLASGTPPSLMRGIKADLNIHKLESSRARALV